MIELVLVMFVMTVAMGMYSTSVSMLARQRVALERKALALQAAQDTLETLRHEAFEQIFVLYNRDPGDDPGGAGTAPGPNFAVAGLDLGAEEGSQWVGTIELPESETAPWVFSLREDADLPRFGLPRDLNADSRIDELDHRADYRVMPVVVRVNWNERGGARQIELCTLLTRILRP